MSPPRLKRLLRISLRMLFVLTTVLCVGLGWTVHRVHQQMAAVTWVRAYKGEVYYDYQDYDLTFDQGDPDAAPPGPNWLHRLVGVDYFSTPADVRLIDDNLRDLAPLAYLTGLETLEIRSQEVVDASPLANLKDLTELSLDCREVRNLPALASLTSLQILILPTATPEEEITAFRNAIKRNIAIFIHSALDKYDPPEAHRQQE